MAQYDGYLDMQAGGIKHESTNAGVVGAIPLLSFSFGTSTMSHANTGSGSSGGFKSEIAPLTVTYATNSVSPTIWIKSLVNEHISKVTLYLRKNDGSGTPQTYLQMDLEQVLITNVNTTGTTADAAIPMETMTLVAAKTTMKYISQHADGSMGNQVQYAYDQRLSQQV